MSANLEKENIPRTEKSTTAYFCPCSWKIFPLFYFLLHLIPLNFWLCIYYALHESECTAYVS